jgi:hypothetical protein
MTADPDHDAIVRYIVKLARRLRIWMRERAIGMHRAEVRRQPDRSAGPRGSSAESDRVNLGASTIVAPLNAG